MTNPTTRPPGSPVEFGPNPTWVARSVRWGRPVPWGHRGTGPGAEKGRFEEKSLLS